jgi:hypothetical protein
MKRLLIALFLGLYVSMSFLACAPMMPKENPKVPKGYDPSKVEPVKPVGEGNQPAAKPVEKPAEKPAEEPAADEGTE